MARLTKRNDVTAYVDCDNCNQKGNCNIPQSCLEVLANRLAAYEDAEESGRWVALPPKTHDIDFMRIFELITADGEGRAIILPCKLGDFLYAPTRNFVSIFRVTAFEYAGFSGGGSVWIKWELYEGITGKFNIDGVRAREVGKTVFLTHEEAEAALKGAKTDG